LLDTQVCNFNGTRAFTGDARRIQHKSYPARIFGYDQGPIADQVMLVRI